MNLLNLIEDSNAGYDNLRALMQAIQNSQDALLTIGGEPITLTYPEARFMYGKYKAYLKAGRQEEFLNDLGDPVRFDMHMKQLRQLLDKQKNFRGSVPGERGVAGDVPQGMEEGLFGGTAKTAPGQLKTYAVYDGFTIYYDPAKEMFVTAGTGEYKDKFRARGFPAHSAQGGVGTAEFYGQQMTGGQRKQPISMDRSVTGGAHESVAEAEPVPGKYSGHFYDAEILPNGDYKVVKINNKSDHEYKVNPLNLKVGDVVPKGRAHALQYTTDGGMFDQLKSVNEISLQDPNNPTTQTAGKINWERMLKDYMENKPYSEFEFSGDRPLTIYRSQVYAILKDFGRMKPQQKVNIILNTFGDKYAMVDYIDKLRSRGMMPKKVPAYVAPDAKPVPAGQLDLPGMGTPKIREAEAQKKNSEQTSLGRDTARSPKVQRAFQLARARQAAAGSDIEAFVKDELEKSEQAQAEIEQLKTDNEKQDQQIQQLAAKVRQQDQAEPAPTTAKAEPAKTEPAKEKPKDKEKPAEPKKKADTKAAEKPAEPKQQRDEPRAEPAPAPQEQPQPGTAPTQPQTQPGTELPPNVLPFPGQAARRRRKGGRKKTGTTDQFIDPMAAATAGVDISQPGTGTYGLQEDQDELHIGDPVIIKGNVEYGGKTGDIVGFGRDKHFIIVDLYNFGQHAFHASNVEYNEYADQEDYIDENQRMDKFNIAQPPAGGTNKQREQFLDARDRLFRQMTNASPGEKEAIRLKIADLEGQAQAKGIRIREADEFNRAGHNAIRDVGDWREKIRVMQELMKDRMLMSDPEAKAAIEQRIGDLIRVGQQQGYLKEALSDKAMAVLRGLKSQPQATQPTAMTPAQQADVDAWAKDVERNLAPKLKPQAAAKPVIDLNVPEPKNIEDTLPNDLPTLRRRIQQLDELIKMKEMIDKLFLKAQNVRGGIYPGLQADIEAEELYPVPQTDQQYNELRDKYAKDLAALQKFIAMKKAVYREGRESLSESSALVRLKQARQALSQQGVDEGLADEFMKMAKDMGMNPRLRGTPDEERARTDAMLKQRAKDRANAPKPAPVSDEERANLEARLKELEAKFDPDFEYSDDHSFWSKQNDIKKSINSIKQRLKQGVAEDAEPMDREFALVKKLGRLGERIVQSPKLWDKYSEAVESNEPDWIVSLIQDGIGATYKEVLRLSDLFGEIGGGLGRIIDFAWAVKEGTWEEDFLNPYREYRNKWDMAEAQTDYQKRRQRERDVDAGKPVAKQRQPKMTDYQKRRAQQKKEMELGEKTDRSPGKVTKSEDPCWSGYHMVGKKMKNGREVPNCVPGKKG